MRIGTTILPPYLFQQGFDSTFDAMKELAEVDTVMVFSNNDVIRQYQPNFQPPKDPENGDAIATVNVRVHEEYYQQTSLRQTKREEEMYTDRDVIDEACAAAGERNMEVWGRILEPYMITGAIPGSEICAEIDTHGNPTNQHCFNHPEYAAYWDAVVRDLVETHPEMTGFKFGQERGGPIGRSIGASPSPCFCPHCVRRAEAEGLNVSEARKGLLALESFSRDHARDLAEERNDDCKPVDGYFIEWMRIITQYPEVLKWEKFWMNNREAQRKRIYTLIKSIRQSVQVGWHIDHGMSWDPITRIFWPYAEMTPHSDWLMVALYFDALGPRSFNHFRKTYERLLFADLDPADAHRTYLQLLGYDANKEPDYQTLLAKPQAFTPEYVYRETLRAKKSVTGKSEIFARIGFDMPHHMTGVDPVSPETVRLAVKRALEAGAEGLFCGREWDELTEKNCAAFGDAVRDWRKK